jgi:hypothetical protein
MSKNKTVQTGLFGGSYEPGKWTPEELESMTGEPAKKEPEENQANLFDKTSDPNQGAFKFGESEDE